MNIIRSSLKSQVLDLRILPIFSPLKMRAKKNTFYGFRWFESITDMILDLPGFDKITNQITFDSIQCF